jgi:hypothetical protein
MRAIYSFWSKPFFSDYTISCKDIYIDKRIGGFKNMEYFLKSFCVSVAKSKIFFNDVVLYTDGFGYELFKKLNLDINIENILDNSITKKEERFWAISKIKAYKIQKEPFVHIDNDLFFFKSIPKLFENLDILGAWNENKIELYNYQIDDYNKNGNKLVIPEITKYIKKNKKTNILAINCGLVAVKNLDFIKEYSYNIEKYLDIVEQNYEHINTCFFLEQFYIAVKAKVENIKIGTYTDLLGPTMKKNDWWIKNEYFCHLYGNNKIKSDGIKIIDENFNNLYENDYFIKKVIKNYNKV